MVIRETLAPPQLPHSYWSSFGEALKAASQKDPILALLIVACIGLVGHWISVAYKSRTAIAKEKIKYDYKGKKIQSEYKVKSLQAKLNTQKPKDGGRK